MSEEEKEEFKPPQEELIVEDYKDKYLRAIAEAENLRKRMQRERQEGIRHAIADVLCEFLKPVDQFETALSFAEASSPEVKAWALGFEMIMTQFKDVFSMHGVTSFEAEGEPFDPHLHQALEMVESDKYPPGTVVTQVLRGYRFGERVLRPAQVKVSKEKEKADGQEKE
ncbi:MAG: nucleotide exchange factor GrpE [Verrucomicrobia bacterium]|nr:nucleotide exchange factor GrpE [Verrucomicrobiota bacterium]